MTACLYRFIVYVNLLYLNDNFVMSRTTYRNPPKKKHWVLEAIFDGVLEFKMSKRKSEQYFWMKNKLYNM